MKHLLPMTKGGSTSSNSLRALATWSGGKDSCYAFYLSMRRGIRVTGLLNATAEDRSVSAFQGVPSGIVRLQAQRVGLPLYSYELSQPENPASCLAESAQALDRLRKRIKFNALISGHNDPADPQREHMLNLCRPRGLALIDPHCGHDTRKELESFLKAGFHTIIVKIQKGRIDPVWLGRPLDGNFLDYLALKKIVNFCGDDEYQSLVLDGPIFTRPIELTRVNHTEDAQSYQLSIQTYR